MDKYINREMALKYLAHEKTDIVLIKPEWVPGLQRAYEDIADLPAADVAPVVHGRWVMRGGRLYCSACKERACVTRDMEDYWYTKGTAFCPNCGAKMQGG